MPTLFRATCGECGHETPILTSGYAAVFVDRPVMGEQSEVAGAATFSGKEGAIASTNDPRFVILTHPIEHSILASTGYTWRDLFRQGRYVAVSNVICRDCGTLFPRRRLAAPPLIGCISSLALGAAIGVAAGIVMQSVIIWYVGTVVAVGVLATLPSFYVRLRFAARAATLRAEYPCPTCGADNVRSVERSSAVRCPACLSVSLRFRAVGMS